MRTIDRLLFAAGAIFIGGYFLLLAGPSVHTYFSADDMMNLYRAWSPPLGRLIRGNVLFFLHSPFYRPLAEAWYRIIYYFAGFNPTPFKVSNLLFLVANIALTYLVAMRLSQSRLTAGLAALLISFHANFTVLYFDTGFIYDVLAYFFYFASFVWFLKTRQGGKHLRWPQIAGCAALYVCSLNSKEIAVSLPIALLAYELLYVGKSEGWFPLRRWWLVLVTGAITVMFIAGRVLNADSLLQNEAYRPLLTWSRFIDTSVRFANELFYTGQWFTPGKLLVVWGAMLGYALAARSRTLGFAWLFLMISPLPIAFLPARGAPQYYVPYFGWVLYTAAFVVESVDLAVAKLPPRHRGWALRAVGVILVVGAARTLYPYEKRLRAYGAPSVTILGEHLRSTAAQLGALYPRLPPRTRLYFLHDPIGIDWNLYFLVRLNYGDDTLIVDPTVRTEPRPTDEVLATYDHVFDDRGGHLIEVRRPWQPAPVPAIVIDTGRPEVFHAGFDPVTAEHPAIQSEYLISRAFDLGETAPPLTAGERFPNSPLAKLVSPVEVLVDGVRAEVGDKVGWPAQINRYRVDFRVPEKTPPGMAKVTLTCGGVTGPPVEIPVRARVIRKARPQPRIAVDGGRAQLFHRDWTPVTKEIPARPGEDIIAKAIDLGETRPSVANGQPFPSDPLVEIVSKIEVRVNGEPAATSVRVGWPNEVNQYRVDIRIPEKTREGMAKITLRVNGASGPTVEIPVR